MEEVVSTASQNVEIARIAAKAFIAMIMILTAPAEASIVRTALDGMARNPEAAKSLASNMIVGIAMVESTAIYALVMFFVL